jgi:hypothetical protein
MRLYSLTSRKKTFAHFGGSMHMLIVPVIRGCSILQEFHETETQNETSLQSKMSITRIIMS